MTVREMGTRDVETVKSDETVRAAAQRMLEHHVGTLVVVDDGRRPIGFVTDRDIVTRCVAREHDPDETLISDIMSEPVRTLDMNAALESAIDLMADSEVRRLVLTDGDGSVSGLLALDDVLERIIEEGESIGRLLRHQVHA